MFQNNVPDRFEVTIPDLPPSNNRQRAMHYRTRHTLKSWWREQIKAAWEEQGKPVFEKAYIEIMLRKSGAPDDSFDNLPARVQPILNAMKQMQFVDEGQGALKKRVLKREWGLYEDDCAPFIKVRVRQEKIKPSKRKGDQIHKAKKNTSANGHKLYGETKIVIIPYECYLARREKEVRELIKLADFDDDELTAAFLAYLDELS